MRISVFLVIIGLVIIWYGIIPMMGGIFSRHRWRQFRQRLDELRLRPLLDYRIYRRLEPRQAGQNNDVTHSISHAAEGNTFRFIGGFESITDRKTLWIQGDSLTIPVSLTDAHTYILPMREGEGTTNTFDPGEEAPEQIKWDRVSALTEGAKVFVGGSLIFRDERWIFVSSKESPLLVIFYDGPDESLTSRAIGTGRPRNEYWNAVTPYSLAVGALCQILIALSWLYRPSFRLTVITALIALFVPLFPMIPPGILFTTLYRRLTLQARGLRACRDLARLPGRYLAVSSEKSAWKKSCRLPGGETYGMVCRDSMPPEVTEGKIPLLIPESAKRKSAWHIFGVLRGDTELPVPPNDPFATFGALPGEPDLLSKRYAIKAYALESIAWLVLLLGMGLNIFFVGLILTLF